jgi:uncharacterized OB-fold protein
MNDAFPLPDPDFEPLKPFWAEIAERRLTFPKCTACGRFNWYPRQACGDCGGEHFAWIPVSGEARIFSWTVVKRALHAPYKAIAPYIPVIVEFDDAPGVRLVSRWIGPDDGLAIGKPARIVFEDFGYPNLLTGMLAPLVA